MIRKPWPIIIIAFIFFVIPFINVFGTYFFFRHQYSFADYINSLLFNPANAFPLFNMIVPSLIAGTAVYCVKKWSYPVFLICMAWITVQMFSKFSTNDMGTADFIGTILIPMIINIGYVSYILLPKVRAPYFDPRMRWWETKPRYVFPSTIQVSFADQLMDGKMTNISEGGLFAVMPTPIDPNTILKLNLNILDTPLEIMAKVVYRKPDGTSHGLQFCEVSKEQKKNVLKIISRLQQIKCPETRPVPKWDEDLAQWFKTLMTTGKGLVPEVHSVPPRKED